MDNYEIFKLFFEALDSVWDTEKDEDLGNFLSSMNPYLFKDKGSAVPWIYEKFKKEFIKKYENEKVKLNYEDAYNFCNDVISAIEEDNEISNKIKKYFSRITIEEWKDAFNKVTK